jgi:aldose 1-epimerase
MLPDKDGTVEDCVLGFDTWEDYDRSRDENPCFGSTIGRVANRTANSRFEIDGVETTLDVNCGDKHHLHGGA